MACISAILPRTGKQAAVASGVLHVKKPRAGSLDSAVLRRFFESRFEPYLLTNPDATTSGLITGY